MLRDMPLVTLELNNGVAVFRCLAVGLPKLLELLGVSNSRGRDRLPKVSE